MAGTPPEGRDRVGVGVGWCPAALCGAAPPDPAVVRWGQLMGVWSGLKLTSVPPLRNIGAPSRCVCKRANESPHVWSLRPRNGGDGAWACAGSARRCPPRLTCIPALPPGVRGAGLGGVGGAADGRRRPPSCGGVGTGSRPCPRGRRALNRHLPEELRGDEWGEGWRGGEAGGHRDQSSGSLRAHEPPSHLSFYLCPWPCPSDNQGVGVVGAHTQTPSHPPPAVVHFWSWAESPPCRTRLCRTPPCGSLAPASHDRLGSRARDNPHPRPRRAVPRLEPAPEVTDLPFPGPLWALQSSQAEDRS